MLLFDDAYARYATTVRMALRDSPDEHRAFWARAAVAEEDNLDSAWDRASRAMPPLQGLGAVRIDRRPGASLLHDIARQAVWAEPDRRDEGRFAVSVFGPPL